jgi:hypothetical protein
MPTFRCDFDTTGDLVLPADIDQVNVSTTNGFRLTIRNAPVDSEGHAPGLVVCVVGRANCMETAQEELREALAAQLDLLSFVTHSRFKIVGPRRLVEWEEGQKRRRFESFYTTDARYPPDPELDRKYLETLATLDRAKPPDFARRALRYFRYGLIDAQTEDQFMRFWLALEIVAENTKERDSVPITCPACNTAMECGACGAKPTRVPMAKQAIENLIARIFDPAEQTLSKRLFKARNALMHGKGSVAIEADCKTPLRQMVNELAIAAWNAIMLSIPLAEEGGQSLNFGHRGAEFASGSLIMAIRGIFDHTGDGPHPTDDKMPSLEIGMTTTFGRPKEPTQPPAGDT